MLTDLRRSLRALLRTPGLTTVIVVSLALGTGANAAVYSAVDALLFRPPAGVIDAGRLVDIYTSQINGGSSPAFAGVALGVLGAEAAIRFARTFVYELPVLDLGLAAATTAALVAIVAAAVVPHALRAVRINPVIVLRQ